MNKFLLDVKHLLYWFVPFVGCLFMAYAVTGFIEWSRDPAEWTWGARFCAAVFGLFLGFSVDRRLEHNVRP